MLCKNCVSQIYHFPWDIMSVDAGVPLFGCPVAHLSMHPPSLIK